MNTRPRLTCAIFVSAAALAPVSVAQERQDGSGSGMLDSITPLTPGERIDAARERVRDDALPSEERLRAMRELIDALEHRLSLSETPPETRVRDAVELAESIVAAMSWEGLTTTASVGILTPTMREQAAAQSRRALRAMERFDAAREGARGVDPAVDARGALARARAGLTLALSTNEQDTRVSAMEAAAAIRTVPSLLREDDDGHAENAEAEAQRLLCQGLLGLLEGRAAEARVSLARAARVALSPRARAEGLLGAAFATAQADGAPAAARELDALAGDDLWIGAARADALSSILRADAQRRVALRNAEFAEADALTTAAANASRPYLDLAREGVPGAPPPALRSLLVEKAAVSGGALLGRLGRADSDAATIERVLRALAREGGANEDEARRTLLAALMTPGEGAPATNTRALDALGPFGPDALWRLGVSLSEREGDAPAQRDAVGALLGFAAQFPDDPRAPGAIAGATASAQRVAIASPSDADALALYERTLREALGAAEGQERSDAWRFELGRLLAASGADAEADAELSRVRGDLALRAAELRLSLAERSGDEQRIAERASELETIAQQRVGSDPGAEAARERARGVRAAAELRTAARAGDDQAVMRAASRLADADPARAQSVLRAEASRLVESLAEIDARGEPLSETHHASARAAAAMARALGELSSSLPAGAEGDRVLLARASRLTGDPDAASAGAVLLAGVMQRVGKSPDLLAEYAESLRVAGDQAGAFGAYRELTGATRHDDPRTRAKHWLAWGRMLEILAAQNSGGARSATIRAQADRLRLIDPSLGGQPHRSRIERAVDSAR